MLEAEAFGYGNVMSSYHVVEQVWINYRLRFPTLCFMCERERGMRSYVTDDGVLL